MYGVPRENRPGDRRWERFVRGASEDHLGAALNRARRPPLRANERQPGAFGCNKGGTAFYGVLCRIETSLAINVRLQGAFLCAGPQMEESPCSIL